MYNKYTLFYESPKTGDIYAHAQTVCTRSHIGGGRDLGMRLMPCKLGQISEPYKLL